jgi:UPF0716 protein FxsA
MLPLLLIVFVVVPIVEIAAILQVGDWIGLWPTLALLVADSILGTALMRSQGRAAWRRFNAALAAGRPPAREVLDGALIIVGGALLLSPGFVTDIVGLAFLLPPTRAVIRRLLIGRLTRRMVTVGAGARFRRPGRTARRPDDVEGTAIELDPYRLP